MQCQREVIDRRTVFVRWAERRSDRSALSDAARWLRRAAHPGVVELATQVEGADGVESLATAWLDGPSLADVGPLPMACAAGVGAVVATTVADLHELGVPHGDLRAARIVFDGVRPVLLDPMHVGEATAAGDVAALRRLLCELLVDPPRRLARMLSSSGRRRPASARDLAAALVSAVPDARLPSAAELDGGEGLSSPGGSPSPGRAAGSEDGPAATSQHADPSPGARERRRPQMQLVVALAVAGLLALGCVLARSTSHRTVLSVRPPSSTSTSVAAHAPRVRSEPPPAEVSGTNTGTGGCPSVDQGCGPLTLHAGRFRVAGVLLGANVPAATIVLGRWWCGAALPVALDQDNGRLWVWTRLPGTASAPATPLGIVPGATSLATLADPGGCDALRVVRRTGPAVLIDVASVSHG